MRRDIQIFALIATCDRSGPLERALRSILKQTRRPDHLLIIDDSDEAEHKKNESVVNLMEFEPLRPRLIPNYRTKKRAAGAWNTGLDYIRRQTPDPTATYVAILDDDDWWEPSHLASCAKAAEPGLHRLRRPPIGLDMVVAGIVRHDPETPTGKRLTIPGELDVDDLLVGGVAIQGSNLFVRLDKLLEAGCFDENLESATDRDVAIKLAELGDVRFGAIDSYTVHHDARELGRISDKGSPRKKRGLDAFWLKYQGRMSEELRRKCLERAWKLFEWRPAGPCRDERIPPQKAVPPAAVAIVAGIIVDPDRAARLDGLLDDLRTFSVDPECAGMDVVLLPNGPCPELVEIVERQRRLGLRCHPIAPRGESPAPIGRNRTILQAHVYALAKEKPGSVGWILDDDMRLDALVTRGGVPVRERVLHLRDLIYLREQGIAVVLGPETDAPPVPATGMVRLQLVDLHHNLRWMAGLRPDSPLPDRFPENLDFMRRCNDYHYDLARRNTDQLEAPFWLTPARPGETVREALDRLAERLPRILAGEQIFRPIVLDLACLPEPEDAVNRGGNAFVLEIEALRDVPNSVPELGGREVRRSDMVWSLLNKVLYKRRIVRAPLALRHDRSGQPARSLDLDLTAADFRGYALYSALVDQFEKGGEFDFTLGKFKKYLGERLAAFELSAHRVRGLVKSIRLSLEEGRAWWKGCHAIEVIRRFIDGLESEYRPDRLREFHDGVLRMDEETLRAYLDGLKTTLENHRVSPEPIMFQGDPRVANAVAQVGRLCRPGPLRELGRGSEGVVVTDGHLVYKYLDYSKSRFPEERRTFLRSLVGRWPNAAALYPIVDWKEEGIHAVIVYPFENTKPYEQGHGPGLVRLLRECRRNGIVCSNLHPQNLRVAGEVVHLIDYGVDIHPFDEQGWLHMCRRAWLTWRWNRRPDLKNLMRRALTEFDLPELDGFDRFLAAVSDPTAQEDLDDLTEQEVLA